MGRNGSLASTDNAIAKNELTRQMEIFIINRTKDVKRREHMQLELERMGLPFQFVEAVEGAQLTAEDLTDYPGYQKSIREMSEIGVVMSHLKLWRMILNEGHSSALILEDDTVFSDGFARVIGGLTLPTDEYAIWKLETQNTSVFLSSRQHAKIADISFHTLLSNHAGSSGYVLNRKTAQYLLGVAPGFMDAVDTELFSPERTNCPKVRTYQAVPGICMQDAAISYFFGQALRYPSTIEGRAPVVFGVRRGKIGMRIKHLFNYLISCAIRHTGQMRVHVEFARYRSQNPKG